MPGDADRRVQRFKSGTDQLLMTSGERPPWSSAPPQERRRCGQCREATSVPRALAVDSNQTSRPTLV